MRTIKLTLAYDGTDFAGWQIQPGSRTVQATLEETIGKITSVRPSTLASGRTDAGVHALGQVVSFRTESRLSAEVLQRALNAKLPRSMAVLDAADVHDGFQVIRDALRKRYRYVIYNGPIRDIFSLRYAWHYARGQLDADAMQRAAVSLVGTHDFSSFETSGSPRKTSIRTVHDLRIERGRGGQEHLVTLEIEADGFLYNMVRTIVGTLVDVGRGARPEFWPGEVLKAMDRRRAGQTAPPQGLFLVNVEYPGARETEFIPFTRKDKATE
ncbi:MAG: tRNA pseudouridine(38-40) synthase TruA [Planctomycetota bacterium]